MPKSKSIIPEFMSKNPDDTFRFLFPLKLILDEDKFGNSHYEVVIRNESTEEVFSEQISPELLFTHFPLCHSFKNGEKVDTYQNKNIYEESFIIDSSLIKNSIKLNELLDDKTIGTLLGWSFKFLKTAKYINCYLIEQNGVKIILPHFAIGIYYYFRFSGLREAALECNIENLYIMYDDERSDAKIVLPVNRTDEDAAFIHRYASQEIANNEFDNIGRYILRYLNYMRENDIDKEVDDIHLKINFPTKEKFQIDARVSQLTDKKTNEDYYFVHEIINDFSDIGFDKFTKIIDKNKVITDIGDLENLSTIEREIPEETTDVLKRKPANRKHTSTQHQKDRKKTCGSLQNIPIDKETATKDIIIDLLTIYQEQETEDKIDQSLTESSGKGDENTRKVVISSEFEKRKSKPLNEIDNFVIFKQYTSFLEKQVQIKNFNLYEVKDVPTLEENNEKTKSKYKMYGRQRQYLSAKFEYNNLYVGLLELENYPSSAASCWVIISDSLVTGETFQFFLDKYFKENISIPEIIKEHKKTNPRLTKKNHERDESLNDKQLASWFSNLLGKIHL